MNRIKTLTSLILIVGLVACGGQSEAPSDENKISKRQPRKEKAEEPTEEAVTPPSQRIDLSTKGVGPITSLELPEEIDADLVAKGKEVYTGKCTACHKVDKRLVGPAPTGILNRRTPEWIMNMILNPEVMVKEDPLAKELFLEFNGSPMSNQNLTEEEARSVLEYFRTL